MKPYKLLIQISGLFLLCVFMQLSFAARGGFASSNPGLVSNRLSQQSQQYHNQAIKKKNQSNQIIYKKTYRSY